MRNSEIVQYWIHFVAWILFIHVFFNIPGILFSVGIFISYGEVDNAFVHIPVILALFYWNSNFLIPKYLRVKTWFKYLLFLFVSLVGLYLFHIICYEIVELLGGKWMVSQQEFLDESNLVEVVTIGLSSSYALGRKVILDQRRRQEQEKEYLKAELKFLKAQIDPHFVFNSLNTLYSLSEEEEASKTSHAVLRLSNLMRYHLRDAQLEKVPVSVEMQFIEDYIELQKIRFGYQCTIAFTIEGEVGTKKVAPLVFIPFVENAFKHGISNKEESYINISFKMKPYSVFMEIENSLHVFQSNKESFYHGLDNVSKRLNLIYPNQHELDIQKMDTKYCVQLKIEVD